jgi:hypothetical protein
MSNKNVRIIFLIRPNGWNYLLLLTKLFRRGGDAQLRNKLSRETIPPPAPDDDKSKFNLPLSFGLDTVYIVSKKNCHKVSRMSSCRE